jgi:alkylhydroperoxidase/carboxymuconolactone decarboxylase family protein YurZ
MTLKKQIGSLIFLISALILPMGLIAGDKDNGETTEEEIITQFELQHGFIPKPLLLLSERSGVVPAFMKYGNTLMAGGPLTPREINLVTLSAAVALRSAGCTDNQIRKLKKLGVSDEEIIQVVMLASVLANTSTLSEVYEVLDSEKIIQKRD